MIISIIDEKKRIVYFDDIPVNINLIFKEMWISLSTVLNIHVQSKKIPG